MTQFHSRKTPRAQRYDYTSSGMYFVTVCTKDREHYFGEIRRDVLVGHPQIILSDIGEMCNHEIKQLNQKKKPSMSMNGWWCQIMCIYCYEWGDLHKIWMNDTVGTTSRVVLKMKWVVLKMKWVVLIIMIGYVTRIMLGHAKSASLRLWNMKIINDLHWAKSSMYLNETSPNIPSKQIFILPDNQDIMTISSVMRRRMKLLNIIYKPIQTNEQKIHIIRNFNKTTFISSQKICQTTRMYSTKHTTDDMHNTDDLIVFIALVLQTTIIQTKCDLVHSKYSMTIS